MKYFQPHDPSGPRLRSDKRPNIVQNSPTSASSGDQRVRPVTSKVLLTRLLPLLAPPLRGKCALNAQFLDKQPLVMSQRPTIAHFCLSQSAGCKQRAQSAAFEWRGGKKKRKEKKTERGGSVRNLREAAAGPLASRRLLL